MPVQYSLRECGKCGRTVTTKIRFEVFTTLTRARTLQSSVDSAPRIYQVASQNLQRAATKGRKIRLIGVSVSGLEDGGPRQRTVAYLGQLDQKVRLGVKQAAEGNGPARQTDLFDRSKPEWLEVDASRVRVERCRDFGRPSLALKLAKSIEIAEV